MPESKGAVGPVRCAPEGVVGPVRCAPEGALATSSAQWSTALLPHVDSAPH